MLCKCCAQCLTLTFSGPVKARRITEQSSYKAGIHKVRFAVDRTTQYEMDNVTQHLESFCSLVSKLQLLLFDLASLWMGNTEQHSSDTADVAKSGNQSGDRQCQWAVTGTLVAPLFVFCTLVNVFNVTSGNML